MESLTSGTIAGAGSFRCRRCGYVLTLTGAEPLTECPGCGGDEFTRASLFGTERMTTDADTAPGDVPPEGTLSEPAPAGHAADLAEARRRITTPGDYLCYEEDGELRTVALTREWTRIGRSLTADVRFDDQTVSRRHALIVRQPNGVHVHDDRSLNGVFVNGSRVEGKPLEDGDEIVIGRYRLTFFNILAGSEPAPAPEPPSLSGTSE
jgi:predicted  nucleic acid-binding Zn-ribbon protein